MGTSSATARVLNGVLIISIPLNKNPQPSQSGKTLVAATTGGFVQTDAKLGNKAISISVNATVKP